jgi:iron complex outermembrane receptor protein
VRNFESGFDWEPRKGTTLDVVAFRTDVHNEIVFVASQATAGFFQNIPRTRRQGLEMSGTLALPAGLRAFASYSFLDATYQSTVLLASALPEPDSARPGDTFPLSPRHRGTLGIGATRVIKTSVLDGSLAVRAVSSQYLRGDDTNRERPLPGYAVVDALGEGEAVDPSSSSRLRRCPRGRHQAGLLSGRAR